MKYNRSLPNQRLKNDNEKRTHYLEGVVESMKRGKCLASYN
jgi:hypothetical protein